MFLDQAKITLKSGNGGPGCISFKRDDRTPKGGPNGGNGGRGANIYIKGNKKLNSLWHFRYKHRFYAENGRPGEGSDKHGRDAHDLTIEVPLGTEVYNEEEILLYDILDEEPILLVLGGIGGIGNKYLATSVNRTPRFSIPRGEGVEKVFFLKMKLIGDIGLVGLPNSGKSSLLNKLTNANSVTGNYSFTTLNPVLGSYDDLTIVDLPGIIEHASDGKGLGIQFLKHIERCGFLFYIIDCSENPQNDLEILQKEFEAYKISKPYQIIFNKIDLLSEEELIELQKNTENALFISVKENIGIENLYHLIHEKLKLQVK